MNLGPLEAKVPDLVIAASCFTLVFTFFAQVLLPRLREVLEERVDATEGKTKRAEEVKLEAERIHDEYKNALAEAHRDLAHIRQEALEQGAALVAAAREEGVRQRDALIADARARIEADKTLAAAELNESVRHLAIDLAGRIVGEPLDEFAGNSGVIDRHS